MKRRTWGWCVLALAGALVPGLASAGPAVGAVYTMTNEAAGNRVVVFDRDPRGLLTWSAAYPTGGTGTGAGLGSQGAVTLGANGRFLFAVNPGSDDVSVFGVTPGGLWLVDRVPSGGAMPTSVTTNGRLVYVLNAGSDSITGFVQDASGRLAMLPGSTRGLSGTGVAPAQVQFSPDGRLLVVTEKATDIVTVFTVGFDGMPSDAHAYASAGATPFGFSFGQRGQLFVTEAAGGAAGASTVSSYEADAAGMPLLQAVSPALPTGQTAACWMAVDTSGHYAYATNTGSNTVTAFAVDAAGRLSLLDPGGDSGPTGPGPIDIDLSVDDRFVYVLNGGDSSLSAFRSRPDGGLQPIEGIPTGVLPGHSAGLAAR